MQVAIVFIAVAVIGLAALVAAGWFGEQQSEPVRDVYRPSLESERVTSDAVADIRFGLTPMGYDMAEVDEWLARLARELDHRESGLSEQGSDEPLRQDPTPS